MKAILMGMEKCNGLKELDRQIDKILPSAILTKFVWGYYNRHYYIIIFNYFIFTFVN